LLVTVRNSRHHSGMGLLDRLIGGLNRVDQAASDLEYRITMDRRFAQADRLAAEGVRNEGVLTGIKRRFNDGTADTIIRLSWYGPDERSCGVLLGTGRREGLRLGASVAIRVDENDAVLDWRAMWSALEAPGQRRTRFVPDPGVDDSAFDIRVLRRWKEWTPARARVVSFAHRTVLGMPVDNVDIVLDCADGVRRTNPNEDVPFYGAWFLAPGSDVPVVLDPKGGDRAQIDWRKLAVDRAATGGRWQEPAPQASLAAARLTAPSAPPPQAASMGDPFDPTPAPGGLTPIEGVTVEQWAAVTAGLMTARVPPAQYDDYATRDHGVPPGRWTAIDQAWTARQRADWRVGAAMGEAVSAARKAAKSKRSR
jgi:hypothetical protein